MVVGLASCVPNKKCGGGGNNRLSARVAGGLVHGKVDKATPSVRQFLGIPFAEPPVGNLRFAAPKPARPFGELHATSLPPTCVQIDSQPADGSVTEFNPTRVNGVVNMDEDCLALNVWAPLNKAHEEGGHGLPVLVFIYGGGFGAGSTDVAYQIPAQWVDRTKKHIVVSFNYRVGIFGFATAAGMDQYNAGLRDQRLAVEWVRDNIAAFGGDPSRIVLWGQSAGAISIGHYSYAYPKDPIVAGFIMDSGSEGTLPAIVPDTSGFTNMAKALGCGDQSSKQELACVRKAAAKDVLANAPPFSIPVADNVTAFSDYESRAAKGKVSNKAAIIGTNEGEDSPPIINYFFCPGWESAKARIVNKAPVFRYEYHGAFTNIAPDGSGAHHSAELPLLFGTHNLYRGNSTELEWETSAAMQDAWLAFAKGDARGLQDGVGWPVNVNPDDSNVRHFGDEVAVRDGDNKDLESMCSKDGQSPTLGEVISGFP
ncbi:acetylcholinesterase [Ilyonectria destructans]|nr:acetylcholinesterase [Ilyonectria destructans]